MVTYFMHKYVLFIHRIESIRNYVPTITYDAQPNAQCLEPIVVESNFLVDCEIAQTVSFEVTYLGTWQRIQLLEIYVCTASTRYPEPDIVLQMSSTRCSLSPGSLSPTSASLSAFQSNSNAPTIVTGPQDGLRIGRGGGHNLI